MNRWLCFGLGIIAGFFGCIILLFILSSVHTNETTDKNIFSNKEAPEFFEHPKETLDVKEFEVFQVLPNGDALAIQSGKVYNYAIYYLLQQEEMTYYDSKEISVPKNKVVKVVGTYRYNTPADTEKTVPVVKFMDKTNEN